MEILLEKVTYDDKWIEYWTKEDVEMGNYSTSSKSYMFREALEKAGLLEYRDKYGVKGLILSGGKNGEYSVRLSNNIMPSFEDLYQIEDQKDRPNRDYEYESVRGDELKFVAKVAELYAKMYHEKMMRDLRNVDLFI